MFILDAKGMIRSRDEGGPSFDAMIETLVKEAENGGRSGSSTSPRAENSGVAESASEALAWPVAYDGRRNQSGIASRNSSGHDSHVAR